MNPLSLKSLSELPAAAKQILSFAGDKKIFCFYGELGAGKTTLIKEICKQLGVKDAGSSPTFSLVNEYKTAAPTLKEGKGNSSLGREQTAPFRAGGDTIYHFDLYRLKSESEIYDIGYEDYLFSGNYCFIEWPEKIERLLPEDYVRVQIEVKNDERIISLS
ncbi:MAG: tRNA (adenosine(37)-N6)-threonylcarbamoyltransferase complex ATPase subunit type 1 TsaE [Bacteroidetes bacterium]|nr:tRNA (adenosine(37)-N6)-threonylcarbamoyltransferase complex ATPase subunit type 1 TsaE [Bacteroidota bacterium]